MRPRVELQLAAGVWTDITGFVYQRDPIRVRRGRSEEATRLDPGSCTFTVNNRDGRFSPRNPRGPWHGQIGRNTPVRVSVRHGDRALDLTEDSPTTGASAPDTAALSISEVDARVEAETRYWGRRNLIGQDGSWALFFSDNRLTLFWEDPTTVHNVAATEPVPPQPGRRAVRAAMFVGASGAEVTFYTADTIAGPWTQLGESVFVSGASSIRDSGNDLLLGNFGLDAFPGRILKAELRDGINGTVVADPDFTAQADGATSFTDSSGNTWTVEGDAVISNRRFRFHGEVSNWPQRWSPEGNDVYAEVEAAGILRRLGAGSSALDSAVKRFRLNPNLPASPVAYWPMEDNRHAESVASALDSGRPMTITGDARLAADDTFQCSRSLPTLGDALFKARIPRYVETGVTEVSFLLAVPSDQTPPDGSVVVSVDATGTAARWELRYGSGGTLQLVRFDAQDNAEGSGSVLQADLNGRPALVSLEWQQAGSDLNYFIQISHLDAGDAPFVGNVAAGETFGVATRAVLNRNRDLDQTVVGHLTVYGQGTTLQDNIDALRAHSGETPFDRFDRLCREEDVPQRITGLPEPPWMGPQLPQQFTDLAEEMAVSDSGMLLEPRDFFSLGLRTHRSLHNLSPTVTLDYEAGVVAPPLEPVDDDQQTRNDVTVSQEDGASARQVAETGRLSIRPPPDGVGRYDERVDVSSAHGEFLPQIAGWRLHLGTVDEARFPTISVDLANERVSGDSALLESILFADSGDRLVIENPPDWLPPQEISQIVQGYTEEWGEHPQHSITFNCSPESPWRPAAYDAGDRYGTTGSLLLFPISETLTSITVAPGRVLEDFEDAVPRIDLSGTWQRSNVSPIAGGWSLRSAVITHNEQTDATLAIPPDVSLLRFTYRVSSEENFDFFQFLTDGIVRFQASGEFTQTVLWDVSAASEVTFRYVKDGSVSGGDDAAWVDDLVLGTMPVWTSESSEFPLDIMVGGERMTVTNITALSNGVQTFTVQRSQNGIVKPHPAGTAVELFQPAHRAL